MLRSILNNHIIVIQCGIGTLSNELALALKYDKCTVYELSKRISILDGYRNILYKYQPLEDTLTYFYQFDFEDMTDDDYGTASVTIGSDTFSYIGTGEVASDVIAASIYKDMEVRSDLNRILVGNTIYVYSYTSSDATSVSADYVTATNQINSEEILLNLWNCVNLSYLCDVINHANILINSKCTCK